MKNRRPAPFFMLGILKDKQKGWQSETDRGRIFLEKVKNLINQNMDEEQFSAVTLAEKMYLSPSQLNRKLKAAAGSTAGSLIRESRLSHASNLLSSEELPVQEVAFEVGYPNTSNFCRSFKRRFGCSPKEYARRKSNMRENEYKM